MCRVGADLWHLGRYANHWNARLSDWVCRFDHAHPLIAEAGQLRVGNGVEIDLRMDHGRGAILQKSPVRDLLGRAFGEVTIEGRHRLQNTVALSLTGHINQVECREML